MDFIRKKRWIIAAAVALALASGTALFLMRRHQGDKESSVVVRRGTIVEAVYGIGTVYANRTYQLKVGIPSTIDHLFVEEGQAVKQGQKLISLEGMRTFVAPFSGTVTTLANKVGEAVFPQIPILTLMDFNDRYLLVSVEQQGAVRVKQGQPVKMSFESLRDKVFNGVVESSYSNQDRFLVRIRTTELLASILPGMTADVSIVVGQRDNVLLLPATAISKSAVRLIQGQYKTIKTIPVKIGLVDGDTVEVISNDLRPGDHVLENKGQ